MRWWLATLMAGAVLAGGIARAAGPEIRVVDLKGLEAALAAHKGQGVLLNFWAIRCEPCVAELPDLLEVGRQFRSEQGVVLTVSYDLMLPGVTEADVLKQMRGFVAARRIDAPVYIYNAPDYDAINQRFGLPGPVPVTIALDRSGNVVARHAGKSGRDSFAALMHKGLQQPGAAPDASGPSGAPGPVSPARSVATRPESESRSPRTPRTPRPRTTAAGG
jgi:thiol-disulfide isomerase/thioredoxin